ncbi:hypothetical protein RAN53_03135 [Halomonas sp. SSL-5]|uniref:hypothetical protein n=1 Tax=Halomonas sp. SSL-5 TaxID=3065855 RepID=UPI0027389EE2|nr:hypothetical protein [Halomonas sp. SSL-5]MDY7115336.1 hypothetical protein [Halomonas sp. SSL-5]
MVFVLAGLLIMVGLEWHATVIAQRWSYTPMMPTLPRLGTGLTPLLQWLLLPRLFCGRRGENRAEPLL